jgi:hypothetical protein
MGGRQSSRLDPILAFSDDLNPLVELKRGVDSEAHGGAVVADHHADAIARHGSGHSTVRARVSHE